MKAWFKAMVVATAMVGPMAASVSTAITMIATPRICQKLSFIRALP